MKLKSTFFAAAAAVIGIGTVLSACEKDYVAPEETVTPATPSASFVEQFDNVGGLAAKGWVFKNNSNPVGQVGWRQGRYEAANQVKFAFVGPYIGFQAFNSTNTPNDFVSSDLSALADFTGNGGDLSAWLISPAVPMKNGDVITFYTRASDDALYFDPATDRMQVRANFTDGTADVGNTATSVGKFTNLLLDINSALNYNYQGGYPQVWTKYTVTVSGIPGNGSIESGRFAFRNFMLDTGLQGGTGSSGTYYNATVVGVDSLAFVHN